MKPEELGQFVRDILPHLKQANEIESIRLIEATGGWIGNLAPLLSALDCAMGLLRQCYDEMEHSGGPGWNPTGELEATLRLVLGVGWEAT